MSTREPSTSYAGRGGHSEAELRIYPPIYGPKAVKILLTGTAFCSQVTSHGLLYVCSRIENFTKTMSGLGVAIGGPEC